MRRRTHTVLTVAAAGMRAVTVAGCATGGGSSSSPAPSPMAAGTVHARDTGSLGTILVDARGHTLYLFEADTAGMSTCNGACASAWPPLTVTGAPVAGSGVKADLLGTTQRAAGSAEVTYNSHPLYTFAGDSKAGDTHGQGLDNFGAKWFAMNPAGGTVTTSPSSSGGGGGGYGY